MYQPLSEVGQVKIILYKSLPYLVFIVSATFSAVSAYDYYIQSNPVLAKVIFGVFIGIGLAFSIAVSQFEYALKLIKCRITAILLGIFLIAWLGVSSLYNYTYLAMTQAVDAELNERAIANDRAFSPVITNSVIINTTVLPMLDTLITNLDSSITDQTSLGGCQQLCRYFQEMKRELENLDNQLTADYDEENAKKIEKTLTSLTNLSLRTDITWQKKLEQFNNMFFKLKSQTTHFLTMPLPAEVLEKSAMQFKTQETKLNKLASVYNSGIGLTAFLQAQSDLISIQTLLADAKAKVITVKREPIYFTPITTSFVLLLKQWKHSADRLVIACFLDALGIALILSNITVYRKINP